MSPKILFISHSARAGGAERMLLYFVRWLNDKFELSSSILFYRDGPLREDFAVAGNTYLYWPGRPWPSAVRSVGKRLFDVDVTAPYGPLMLASFRKRGPNLVYNNTVANGPILDQLAGLGCPVITHIHELEAQIARFGPENWSSVKRNTTHYVAASQAVKRNLVDQRGIAVEQVTVVHEFIPLPRQSEMINSRTEMCRRLDIPEDAFVVGGSGRNAWVKGKDLFIQLAVFLRFKHPHFPCYFIWLGGFRSEVERFRVQHDLETSGLGDWVYFVGEVENSYPYYSVFDVLVLPSREDSYPLTMLEAASMGVPTVCFDCAGGAPEFVEQDAGFIVPYLDIEKMADRVVALYDDNDLRQQLGKQAKQKVQQHTVDRGAPQLTAVIEHLIGPLPRRLS